MVCAKIPIKFFSIMLLFASTVWFISDNFSASFAQGNNSMPSYQFNLSPGYVDGKVVLFLTTDASDNRTASSISDSVGYKVNYSPLLAKVPPTLVQQGFDFLNGIKGEGNFGTQLPIASALNGDSDYTPLVQVNFVKWNNNTNPVILKSADEVYKAQQSGTIQILKTNVIVNSPSIAVK